jgi:DNA-binding transcriptional MerR regulator
MLTSGGFARRSGLSAKALRLYDRIGLLRPAEVESGNGYRRYHESQLYAARLIALLRRLDMPLAEIAAVVRAPGTEAAGLLDRYWTQAEQRLAAQRELAGRLAANLAGADPPDAWEVRCRDVAGQVVLTEQRHVTAAQLSWIGDATARLTAVAAGHGGAAGPRFVVFHGPVGEEAAGPVEVCLPVDAARFDAPAYPLRTEPAHRQAYVPVRAGQFEPPLILSAYDAVRRWARATGHRPAGAPREVYGYHPAPGGPVCDVALPVTRATV